MITAGASAYPRIIDFARMRQIADSVGALLFVDMAHIAGLVAAGVHPSPVPHADFVTTHHPQEPARSARRHHPVQGRVRQTNRRQVFPGIQGGPLMHVIAAKAVCFHEALQPQFQGLPAADRQQRQGPRRPPGETRLPHRLRRHRQPPHARRPPPARTSTARSPRRPSMKPASP